jgi:hypothetical protein
MPGSRTEGSTAVVDWAKKIQKSVGGDLQADEQVEAGLFVQPTGTTSGMMIGGLVGAVAANKVGNKKGETAELSRDTGLAAEIPNERLVLGLTGRRLLVWGHAAMSGKPKGMKSAVPLERVVRIQAETGKLTHRMVIGFDDGSGLVVEAPKMGKPDEFVAAFGRLTGR